MRDAHGMVGNGFIQILPVQASALLHLRVIKLEARNPVAGWRLRRLLPQCLLDLLYAAQVEIYAVQLIDPARVTVGIDKPSSNRHSRGIDYLSAPRDQILDVSRAPRGDEATVLDRKRLGSGLGWIDGKNAAADQREVRLPRIAPLPAAPSRTLRLEVRHSNNTGKKTGQTKKFTSCILAHDISAEFVARILVPEC